MRAGGFSGRVQVRNKVCTNFELSYLTPFFLLTSFTAICMKKITFLAALLFVATAAWAQLPSVSLKTADGQTFNTADIANDGKPVLISFWATWCKPCIAELNNIDEVYEEWQEATGVKIIAVSIDDPRTAPRVHPFVKTRGWSYDVLIDENSDFKRAMNVTNVPHAFILDGKGNVVYQHPNYKPGDEHEYLEKLKELAAASAAQK